jgi:multidrug efflux pump subunit AcrB
VAKKPKRRSSARASESSTQLKPLQRLSLFFFDRPRTTALIWLIITVFGALSYTTLLQREGFPSVNSPFAVTQGTYLVNDPVKVDKEVAKPLSDFLLKQDGVKSVQTQSFDNFYNAIVSYKDDVNAENKSQEIQKNLDAANVIPDQATAKVEAFKFGFTQRGDDMVVSFYSQDPNVPTATIVERAKKASEFLNSKNLDLVESISVIDQFETATNPATGQSESAQNSFDRFGQRQDEKNRFYNSAVIGIQAKQGADNIALDKQVQAAVDALNANPEFKGFQATISASYAPGIVMQVNELQKALLEGLIAVLVVGSIVIAIRASIITVIAMITVLATVNGIMYLIGYSLNTITLFALILGLALIVDDTIIMVEAIDSERKKQKSGRKAVSIATRKISRAMVAATSTAALSFAPLIFVGGILGGFIRAIPITIIMALVISLFVALIFIPLFARFLLLGKKQMGENVREVSAGIEEKIARIISTPMLWAKGSRKKLVGVGMGAVFIGLGFIMAGGFLFQKVTFNIFPPDKDSTQISVTLTFPPNTTIEQAQNITDRADTIVGKELNANFVKASYFGQANIQSALLQVELIDYNKRDIKSPEIVNQLENSFRNFNDAKVSVDQLSAGPPASPFGVRIDSTKDRPAALKLAQDIATYLNSAKLERVDGSQAKIESVSVVNPSIYTRDDGKQFVEVQAKFVDDDTTTLVTLGQNAIKKEFNENRVASYGLNKDAVSFSIGQEEENQDSFKTLAIAFPALLFVIYLLLSFQFKSLFQPLLIFLAIPFSLFGITLGLYLTDNAFSFFAMLGFFALIGLSIKNTILLTDYANQSRAAGMGAVDAAHEALAERFRPLIATSLTAVGSLIPLAIMSPFWEGLAVVLIGGLLSSTFLVITVFPYYYLGSEFIRYRFSRTFVLLTIAVFVALSIALTAAGVGPASTLLALVASLTITLLARKKQLIH